MDKKARGVEEKTHQHMVNEGFQGFLSCGSRMGCCLVGRRDFFDMAVIRLDACVGDVVECPRGGGWTIKIREGDSGRDGTSAKVLGTFLNL